MKIYTKRGDDGTTGLYLGGRVSKHDLGPEAYGTVDESVPALGVARAHSSGPLAERLLELQRDLFVVAAELATEPTNRHKLEDGTSRATEAMVTRVETWIDEVVAEVGMPKSFVVPGGNVVAGALDLARTVVRRAERRCVGLADTGDLPSSYVVPYLNRLADYIYMLARAAESEWVPSKEQE